MANWYTTRGALKRAAKIDGSEFDAQVDRAIEAASRRIDSTMRRRFIPKTETRLYDWPQQRYGDAAVLWLDYDLLSVSALKTMAQDASPTTIPFTDYYLAPANFGPPYDRIEIDLSSTAAFESGSSSQRSISVAGQWGYSNDTVTAGTVTSGLATDAAATTFVCSDGSLIDVGDTLLIGSEQLFVSERANAASGATLNGAITSSRAAVTIDVNTGSALKAKEMVLVNSERMFIESIASNVITVIRGFDGSVLAAHADLAAIQVFRTLTVERGLNGTTAATHANSSAVSKYQPPMDIVQLCMADAVWNYQQEIAGWARIVGPANQNTLAKGESLADLRRDVVNRYKRVREATI